MLKDIGIPPMQFREKTCVRGASVFRMERHRDNTPPVNSLPYFYPQIERNFWL